MWKKKLSMTRSVHPQLNIYKRQQDLSIYLSVTTVFYDFHFLLVLFSDWKKRTQRGILKMTREVILTKTQQGYNIDVERKDK